MNQLRVSLTLSRRLRTGLLTRTAVQSSKRTFLHSNKLPPSAHGSWFVLIKKSCDHGPEILVLIAYAVMCVVMLFRHFWKKLNGWEITILPSNTDLATQFSGPKLDWNDSRGQRTMGPLCRRHIKFFENKLGWKDDVKDLLDEIYSYSRPDQVMPDQIVMPADMKNDKLRAQMVIGNDKRKTTELMRSALEEVLAEQGKIQLAKGSNEPGNYFYAKPAVMAQTEMLEETPVIEEIGIVDEAT